MTANELRIGNYISDDIFLYQVTSINEHSVWAGCEKLLNFSKAEIKDCFKCDPYELIIENLIIENTEPIPLTEEWLLKFGAKSTELNPAKNGIWITSEIDEQGCWVCISHGVGVVVVNIQYVHQLQNLYFALTGEEL